MTRLFFSMADSMYKWLTYLIVTALSICACFLGALYFFQEKLLFQPDILAEDYTFAFQTPFEEIRLPVDGAVLHGLHFRHEQPKGAIVFFHGNAGALDSWGTIGEQLAASGYDCYLFDYRGYGKSSGTIQSLAALFADADAIMTYVQKDFPTDRTVVLVGYSLGSGLAARAADKFHIQHLILLAPYFSLRDVVHEHMPFVPAFLFKYPLHSAIFLAHADDTQTILIHGRQDNVIPIENSRRLAALLGDKARLFELGAGHNNIWNKAATWQIINAALIEAESAPQISTTE
ncbi:MAG: alpha/beta fold hydrolase [Cardiobacteriaceae bacterium]|nr:alpha/beta fold hydrolase [Cardiobacteriaceae bacterium]